MTRRLVLLALCGLMAGCEMPSDSVPNSSPQVIAFTASWCGPCKKQAPLIDQIEAAGVRVTRIDIDQQRDLAQEYRVTAVPTYLYYEGSRLILRTHRARDVLHLVSRR